MSGKLNFYITQEHPCNYLDARLARTLVADPRYPLNRTLHTRLSTTGFRRSGNIIYKPHCNGCNACVPVRITARQFTVESRKHKRVLKINRDLEFKSQRACFKDEYFNLYCKYLNARHAGGGMDNPTPEEFNHFLICDWADTLFYEITLNKRLVAVSVVDRLDDGLSAVYTFYDPDYEKRSPGIFAILMEIMETRRLDLDWLYLGYWIADCQKMMYKNQFGYTEYFSNGSWHPWHSNTGNQQINNFA